MHWSLSVHTLRYIVCASSFLLAIVFKQLAWKFNSMSLAIAAMCFITAFTNVHPLGCSCLFSPAEIQVYID